MKVKCLINNLVFKGKKYNKNDVFEVDFNDAVEMGQYKMVKILQDELVPDNNKASVPNVKKGE